MVTKYFVISLPRSGTSTISKMSEIVGYEWSHPPHVYYDQQINGWDKYFFSDTPIFNPKVVEEICLLEKIEPKFIFIDREFKSIYESWVKCGLYRNYTHMFNRDIKHLTTSQIFDINTYNEAFDNNFLDENNYGEVFHNHKNTVIDLVKKYNKELLMYNFKDGWKPFCDFLNVKTPNKDIPWINKNKMFDKI